MNDLLRRAWDTLDTFKQAYPENWNQEDEQVLEDLMRADLKLLGVKLKWVGLTDEERNYIWNTVGNSDSHGDVDGRSGRDVMSAIEAKLKQKNGSAEENT